MTEDEAHAPMTRLQRVALIHLPVFLLLAFATFWRALAEGGDPLAAKLLVVAGVIAMLGGLVWAQRSGECPDEREQAIKMKAFRNAFVLLFVGVIFTAEFTGPDAWDPARAAVATAFLSMALWAGSVLYYARKGD